MSTHAADRLSVGTEPGAELRQLLQMLDTSQLPTVDFDHLKDRVRALLMEVQGKSRLEQELNCLRRDYQARIAGMLKAVAVASRRQGSLEAVLAEIEQLKSLDATALIAAYNHASARFRDSFRSSFAPPTTGGRGAVKPQDYK